MQSQALLMRLLDVASTRRDVLLSNLANTETPGFQRKTVASRKCCRAP